MAGFDWSQLWESKAGTGVVMKNASAQGAQAGGQAASVWVPNGGAAAKSATVKRTDWNLWGGAISQAVAGIGSAYGAYVDALAQRSQLGLQAGNSRLEADNAMLKSAAYEVEAAGYEAQSIGYMAQASTHDVQAALLGLQSNAYIGSMYGAYTAGEWEAMERGLMDAQNIAAHRAGAASRGVKLNEGSAAETEASARLAAAYNQAAIQKNTIESAMYHWQMAQSYVAQQQVEQGAAAASRKMSESALHMRDSSVRMGEAMVKVSQAKELEAQAYDTLASGISPWGAAFGALFSSVASGLGTYGLAGGR